MFSCGPEMDILIWYGGNERHPRLLIKYWMNDGWREVVPFIESVDGESGAGAMITNGFDADLDQEFQIYIAYCLLGDMDERIHLRLLNLKENRDQ